MNFYCYFKKLLFLKQSHQLFKSRVNKCVFLNTSPSCRLSFIYKYIYFYAIHNNNKTHNIKCYNLMVLGYMFRPYCGHLQAN